MLEAEHAALGADRERLTRAEAAAAAATEELERARAAAAAALDSARAAWEVRRGELEAALIEARGELAAAREEAARTESVARAALEDELDRERAAGEPLAADLQAALLAREAAEAALAHLRGELAAAATRGYRRRRCSWADMRLDDAASRRRRSCARSSRLSAPAARWRRTRWPRRPRWPRPPARRCRTGSRSWSAAPRPTPPAWSASPASRPRRQRPAPPRNRTTLPRASTPRRPRSAPAKRSPPPRPNRLSPPPPPSRRARRRRPNRLSPPPPPSRRGATPTAESSEPAAAESPGATPTAESPSPPPPPSRRARPRRPNRPSPAAESPEPAAPEVMSPAGPPQRDVPLLRGALVKLAHDDPAAAGRLLAGLLPAQGAVVAGPLAYDLTDIREVGTFGVDIADGAATAQALERPRPRREAAFHLTADALTLAEVLAGVDHRVGRFRGSVRVRKARRHKPLRALGSADLGLTAAARAGARLEPAPPWQALAYAVHPSWTSGLVFTVASTVADETWHLTARDGGGLAATSAAPEGGATASVTMSRPAFDRLLCEEPHPAGDRPSVRGDREAVAALLALITRARS